MSEGTTTPGNAGAPQPTKRNAALVCGAPMACFVLAPPLGNFLGQSAFRMAPTFAILAGMLLTYGVVRPGIAELNSAAKSELAWWHLFIPIYGLYWAAMVVPAQMRIAKEKAGKPAPRGAVVYLLLFVYALAADLNDLAES